MFERLTLADPDPILGLTEAYRKDPSPDKINLGVGVYRDAEGKTPIFKAVREAHSRLLEEEQSKSYLPIAGLGSYLSCVEELYFGELLPGLEGRLRSVQALGGTGALRVAGDLLKQFFPTANVWISRPSWENHRSLFESIGFRVQEYPYFEAESRSLDTAMLETLSKVPRGDVVLLHACCHNPTGVDPSEIQWKELAEICKRQGWLPFFDSAYSGFALGLERDPQPIRWFAQLVDELLLASSFSKTFGLYGERTGALTLLAAEETQAEAALSWTKKVIRANYSSPPTHGASLVAKILSQKVSRESWSEELGAMRDRLRSIRESFRSHLEELLPDRDFSFIVEQLGLFSFSGLTKSQVRFLRDEKSIYIVSSGRINVAGINQGNLDYLCQSIAQALRSS